jgi:hypothetical protein
MEINSQWSLACLSLIFFSLHQLPVLIPLQCERLSEKSTRRLNFLELNDIRHDREERELMKIKPFRRAW